MSWHFGRNHNPGRLKFTTGTMSHMVDGVRQIFRNWRVYEVDGLWGISFGTGEHKRFIGIMALKERSNDHERIK